MPLLAEAGHICRFPKRGRFPLSVKDQIQSLETEIS